MLLNKLSKNLAIESQNKLFPVIMHKTSTTPKRVVQRALNMFF